jgi:choline dehydrogenase-like flavoprotein
VAAGAGGATLAQRLARRGWKVVVLEAGPFWDPDADWVSDEAGSHKLFWTDERIIGGEDPVELDRSFFIALRASWIARVDPLAQLRNRSIHLLLGAPENSAVHRLIRFKLAGRCHSSRSWPKD